MYILKKYTFDIKEKNILTLTHNTHTTHNMKNILNLTTGALFLALAIFVSCGGGSDPVPVEDVCQTKADFFVVGTATVKSVSNSTGIVTNNWTGFTVAFSGTKDGGSYVTNVATGPNTAADASLVKIWPASGTWKFTDDNCTQVTLSAAGLADRTASLAVTATQMSLSFSVPESETGRTYGIGGDWDFEFTF